MKIHVLPLWSNFGFILYHFSRLMLLPRFKRIHSVVLYSHSNYCRNFHWFHPTLLFVINWVVLNFQTLCGSIISLVFRYVFLSMTSSIIALFWLKWTPFWRKCCTFMRKTMKGPGLILKLLKLSPYSV